MDGSWPSMLARSAVAIPSTTLGITCRCWRANPAPCATALPLRTGYCRQQLNVYGASSPAPTMAIGRWSTSSNAVLIDGLPAVEAACAEAITHGVHSADVVLNILARQRDPAPPANILTPAALTLRHAPIADCARYDNLRRSI